MSENVKALTFPDKNLAVLWYSLYTFNNPFEKRLARK